MWMIGKNLKIEHIWQLFWLQKEAEYITGQVNKSHKSTWKRKPF